MPTYEYLCEKCGYRFEKFQKISDNPLIDCPEKECNGKIHRVISPGAGFLFKGSGFYITDYRSDSYKKSADSEKPAISGETKTEKGTDKKTATENKTPEKKSVAVKND